MKLIRVTYIPNIIEPDTLYYSQEYKTSRHICPCGCQQQIPLPIRDGEWSLEIDENENFTISPSILNRECKAHYFIRNSQFIGV